MALKATRSGTCGRPLASTAGKRPLRDAEPGELFACVAGDLVDYVREVEVEDRVEVDARQGRVVANPDHQHAPTGVGHGDQVLHEFDELRGD
jgi:hypothetical protein